MAKIGTAHVEIKPVLNKEALEQIATAIEEAVRKGVEAGMAAARPAPYRSDVTYTGAWNGPICPTCGTRYLGNHTCTVSTS